MNNKLPPKIYELLGKVIKDDISRFSISVHTPNQKGEGFLGDMCFVSLEDKDTEKVFHFIVKQAFTDETIRKTQPIREIYLNEINFYAKVWPRFQKFQDEILNVKIFDKFAKCFTTDSEMNSEKLVFENLKYQGFETFPKRATFDKEHMEYVFKEYGKYHAVSVAFRALNPREFAELSKGLKNQFKTWCDKKEFEIHINNFHELCLQSLIPGEDDDIIEKYRTYLENGFVIFKDSIEYRSSYPVIVHGDCWSNNMMFKYDDRGDLVDLRLVDLQLAKEGSAAADLAYCVYSSGSKEIFAELNHYLEVYYKSLSESIRAFGCDPNKLYPFRVLKEEWKQCCKMGFTMGLLVWKMKLTDDSDIIDFTDVAKNNRDELIEKMKVAKYDEETFRRRTRDIVVHLYENDFL